MIQVRNILVLTASTLMSIETRWDHQINNLLCVTFGLGWTWLELYTMLKEHAHTNTLAVALEADEGFHVPGGSFFLAENIEHTTHILKLNRSRNFPVIVVGADEQVRTIFDILRTMDKRVGRHMYFTNTLEEARHYLYKHYPEAHPAKSAYCS